MISGGNQLQRVTNDPCRLHSFAPGGMAEEVEIVFQMLKAIQHMGAVTYVQGDSDTGETTIEGAEDPWHHVLGRGHQADIDVAALSFPHLGQHAVEVFQTGHHIDGGAVQLLPNLSRP